MTLQRRTPLRRSSPLRAESPATVEQKQLLRHVQQQALVRDGFRCQAEAIAGIPHGGRNDLHHRAPVSRFPELRLELDNLVTLCRSSHDWVHDHPAEAREKGLLR